MKNDTPNNNSQVIFIFLTHIDCNMNLIWTVIKHHNVTKLLHKIFLALWDQSSPTASGGICRTFEQFLAACNSSKSTGLLQYFFNVFWQICFKNINFLTKKMFHIRQLIYLVLANVFSTSFLMFDIHLIKLVQHCLYNSGKGKCSQYIWSSDMFILSNYISAIFYEDRECCLLILPKQFAFVHELMDWFFTSWTFKITCLLNLNKKQS